MSVPEKQRTQSPESSSTSSLGKRRADTEPEARLSTSKIPKVPEFLQHRPHPPAIPLKANPNSQQFSSTSRPPMRSEDANIRGAISPKGNPWQEYYAILKEDQAGQATVVYKQVNEHPIFAVKEHAWKESTSVQNFIRCSHKNTVGLYEAFFENESLYLIYE